MRPCGKLPDCTDLQPVMRPPETVGVFVALALQPQLLGM
jgi:hypothetical protein